jgi:hypothetical protein
MRRALELAETVGVDRLTFVPGEASVWAMSTRYHTDRILTERGQRTDAGVTFDFTDVPEGLL